METIPNASSPQTAIKPATALPVTAPGLGYYGPFPGDAGIAVGPNDLIETINEQWGDYTKSPPSLQSGPYDFQTFFNGGTDNMFDPHLTYDSSWSHRYIMTVDDAYTSIVVAMSPPGSGLGTWCYLRIPVYQQLGLYADLPELGVDPYGIYVSANMYSSLGGPGSSFVYAAMFDVSLSEMESCAPSVTYDYWTHLTNPNGSLAFAVDPAISRSGAAFEYWVNSYQSGACSLTLWALDSSANPVPPPTNYTISTQCYMPPTNAAQEGTTDVLDAGDSRLFGGTVFYGDRLDVALTSDYNWGNGNNNAVVAWFRLTPGSLSVAQQGSFGNAGVWTFYPGIAEDGSGNDLFVDSVSSTSMYVGTRIIGLNASGTLEPYVPLMVGQGPYTYTSRWGDYNGAALDPSNSSDVWVAGEWATNQNTWDTELGEGGA